MGQVVKFFGLMAVGIAVTLIIFGHIVMVLVYDVNYFMETVWPSDPDGISSIWFSLAAFIPGALLWSLGFGLEKLGQREEAKIAAEAAGTGDAGDTGESEAAS